MQTPQEEMQTLIQTCFESQDYATVYKCLNIYKNSFGYYNIFMVNIPYSQ